MATIIIVSKPDQPGLGSLAQEFEGHGYNVLRASSQADLSMNGSTVQGIISFEKVDTQQFRKLNPDLVEITKQDNGWIVRKAPSAQTDPIETLFLKAQYWHRQTDTPAPRSRYSIRSKEIIKNAETNPTSADALFERGMLALEKKETTSAFADFRAALDRNPNHLDALCHIFELTHQNPALSQTLDERRWWSKLFSKTETDERGRAIQELETLVKKSTNPEPFIYLGDFRLESGDKTGAFKAYRQAIINIGPRGIDAFLQANPRDQDAVRKLVFALGLTPDRITTLFPRRWKVGQTVLKVYEPSEASRAHCEHALITYALANKEAFRTPNGQGITFPAETVVLTDQSDPRAIHRMSRVPGINAYVELARRDHSEKVYLFHQLTTAAAIIDDRFWKECNTPNSELSKHITPLPHDFFEQRMDKFFKRLATTADKKVTTEDAPLITSLLHRIDAYFFTHTPHWLKSIRLDHNPRNYLFDTASPGTSPTAPRIGRIDLENTDSTYSLYDLTTLYESPGAELPAESSFKMGMRYLLHRLNATTGKQSRIEDIVLQKEPSDRYHAFNNYVHQADPLFSRVEPGKINSKIVSPATKTRAMWWAQRYLREIELAGTYLSMEGGYRRILGAIESRLPPAGNEPDLGTLAEPTDNRLQQVHKKVQEYCDLLQEDRKLFIKRARDSITLLQKELSLKRIVPDLGSVLELHSLLDEHGYLAAAEAPLRS